MKEEIILHFIHAQTQVRFNHWVTMGDAQHRALGELYELLDGQIDDFVETMIGKPEYGRPEFDTTFSILSISLCLLFPSHFFKKVLSTFVNL